MSTRNLGLYLHVVGSQFEKLLVALYEAKNRKIKWGGTYLPEGIVPVGYFANQFIGGISAPRRIRELRAKYGCSLPTFKVDIKINGKKKLIQVYFITDDDQKIIEKLIQERVKKYQTRKEKK